MTSQSDLFHEKQLYCFDTSSLIALRKSYPKDVFESLHKAFTSILASGKIVVIDMVMEELKEKEEDLFKYIKNTIPKPRLAKFNEYILKTQQIIHAYYDKKGKSNDLKADPHIIACAKEEKIAVVTEELGGGPTQIPYVCRLEGVDCIDIVDFFRKENIKI